MPLARASHPAQRPAVEHVGAANTRTRSQPAPPLYCWTEGGSHLCSRPESLELSLPHVSARFGSLPCSPAALRNTRRFFFYHCPVAGRRTSFFLPFALLFMQTRITCPFPSAGKYVFDLFVICVGFAVPSLRSRVAQATCWSGAGRERSTGLTLTREGSAPPSRCRLPSRRRGKTWAEYKVSRHSKMALFSSRQMASLRRSCCG